MKILLAFIVLLSLPSLSSAAKTELHLGRFSTGDMTGWKEQTFGLMKNKTVYSIIKNGERSSLAAHSAKSASAQVFNVSLDPREYPVIKWSWKIEHTIKKGNERIKEGDDFAARLFVFFPRGLFSSTRAICYVWANKLHKGEHIFSPFTQNIVTVAVDSGEELAGRWTFHQRNIAEDYKNFFGEEAPRIGGVGIMTDTDNTGESAAGYYGDITITWLVKADGVKHKEQKTKDASPKDSTPKEQKQKEPPSKDSTPKDPAPKDSVIKEQPGFPMPPVLPDPPLPRVTQ